MGKKRLVVRRGAGGQLSSGHVGQEPAADEPAANKPAADEPADNMPLEKRVADPGMAKGQFIEISPADLSEPAEQDSSEPADRPAYHAMWEGFYNRGYALYEKGSFEEAEPFFMEALRLHPHNSLVYFTLSSTCKHLGEYLRAIEWCAVALKIEPANEKYASYLKSLPDEIPGISSDEQDRLARQINDLIGRVAPKG